MNTINKITVSGNTYGIVDTDTKVTSAANHYTPSANNNAELTASLSGTAGAYAKDTEYTVLTGVKAQRDAKGHVTGLTYTAQKIKDTNTNTWRPLGTGSNDACAGNDSRLSNARPASDVYTWAKASSKPSYTKSEVGLGNVTNDAQVKRTEMGVASGVATLGTDGKVPSSQLPSYVDDVLEYTNLSSFPSTGESGKIYIAQDTNKTYRWSGSAYTEISSSIVVGTTTGTAFDGKSGYDHVNNTSNPHGVTKAQVGLGNVGNFKAVSTVASQGLTDTEKSNARANIGAGTSSFSGSYNDLTNKPTIPTVNNATLTIQKNGTTVNTFTANASSNVTANITVPTKVSELTNDSGYTTNTGTVTSVKVGSTSYSPSSGVISLPAYPTSLPASDVYSWAKASSKPSYSYSEISGTPSSLPASDVYAWAKSPYRPRYFIYDVMILSRMAITGNINSVCSITGSDNSLQAQTIIYANTGSSDVTVTVPTTYQTPDGEPIELTCPVGGYCEVSYFNVGGTIYARGL